MKATNTQYINELIARAAALQTKHTFHVGQIVEWKPGLQNKTSDGPFIVIEILESPLHNTECESGSPYFQEPLDIVLAHIDSILNGFISFHYDSRRMQPVETDATEPN